MFMAFFVTVYWSIFPVTPEVTAGWKCFFLVFFSRWPLIGRYSFWIFPDSQLGKGGQCLPPGQWLPPGQCLPLLASGDQVWMLPEGILAAGACHTLDSSALITVKKDKHTNAQIHRYTNTQMHKYTKEPSTNLTAALPPLTKRQTLK